MTKGFKFLTITMLLVASPAAGGEIGGSGRVTPIKSGEVAASECAYSGLNDTYAADGMRVQSYGQIIAAFGGQPPIQGIPGMACRG